MITTMIRSKKKERQRAREIFKFHVRFRNFERMRDEARILLSEQNPNILCTAVFPLSLTRRNFKSFFVRSLFFDVPHQNIRGSRHPFAAITWSSIIHRLAFFHKKNVYKTNQKHRTISKKQKWESIPKLTAAFVSQHRLH